MSSPDSGAREPSPWVRRLRSVPSEELAEATTARIDADTARREAELEAREAQAAQKRAEAVRAAAETTAATLARERDEALARVAALEQRLDETTGVTDTADTGEAAGTAKTADAPADPLETEPPARPGPGPEPARGPELVEFAPVRRGAGLVVLLAVTDLAAAGTAVYLAYRDRLTTTPGIAAMVLTVLLAAALRLCDRPSPSVAIRCGTVEVATGEGTQTFELNHPRAMVEVVGQPGSPRRRVVLLCKGRPTLTVDRSLVDVDAFVTAVRRWRPEV